MPTLLHRPTVRDRTLLRDLGIVTVLSWDAIHCRYFPDDTTGKSCQRRLRFLCGSQLIAPIAITACFGTTQERQTVYRLTPKGAEWIAHRTGVPARCILTDPKPDTLLHRVLVARTVLAINDAAQSSSLKKPEWLLENDRWPEAARNVPEPKQYRLAYDFQSITLGTNRPSERYASPVYDDPTVTLVKCRPDAVGLLTMPGSERPISILLEVDNGTETHRQLLSKLPGYHAILSRGGFERSWHDLTETPPTAARVMFVFASEERLRNVLKRISEDPTSLWWKPSGYIPSSDDQERAGSFLEQSFRFLTLADLERPNAFCQPLCYTLRRQLPGERLILVPARPER